MQQGDYGLDEMETLTHPLIANYKSGINGVFFVYQKVIPSTPERTRH